MIDEVAFWFGVHLFVVVCLNFGLIFFLDLVAVWEFFSNYSGWRVVVFKCTLIAIMIAWLVLGLYGIMLGLSGDL